MGWARVQGVALLGCGVHKLPEKDLGKRCVHMRLYIETNLLDGPPARAGVEQPPYSKKAANLRTYGILSQYLGVATSTFLLSGVDVTTINALTLKKWATGYGHASKDQVMEAMIRLSGEENLILLGYNAADAVACAYYVNSLVDPEFWADVKEWRVL
jgi:Holliday junction resolvasome RuvABC endonuclease subunit